MFSEVVLGIKSLRNGKRPTIYSDVISCNILLFFYSTDLNGKNCHLGDSCNS